MPIFEFFKIDNTDLTASMNFQKYVMNDVPVFQSWTDGNMVEHRNSVRTKRSGEFQLAFYSSLSYASFMTLLSTSIQSDGYYNVTAYIQNTNSTDTFEAFLDVTASSKWDFVNNREYHLVSVKVTER